MKEILLSEIISAVKAEVNNFTSDISISGVSTDTRTLKKGDIYFALIGEVYDGHDFIPVAESKGASAVVCSSKVDTKLPQLIVENTLTALQKLAAHYRTKFSIPVIAVTGSNGKTTVKNMIASVLAARYKVFCTDKNYNNEIGLPKSILELDDTYEIAVFEMGMNHPGEIEALSLIAKPDLAVITNIGKAHIGNLGSEENIFKAKMEITVGLKTGGLLVLNSGDKFLKNVKLDAHKTAFVGEDGALSEITASNIRAGDNPACFDVNFKGQSYPCTLPALGKHNVTNALFALFCGLQYGVKIEDGINELKRFTSSSMRTEISNIKGITIIKDYYNSTPDSAGAALKTLANYNSTGKKIAVLGEMLELGDFSAQEHLALAASCEQQKIDYVFFIGADYKTFDKGIKKNKECFDTGGRDLLTKALKTYINAGLLDTGDVVLIKGSRGVRMEEFYESLKNFINAAKIDFTALPSSPTKLYVDISAVKFNYSQIKKAVGSRVEIMPMVKANAYGCGTDIIANVFRDCRYLAVADIKEAALIRRILPDANIVIIYQPHPGSAEEIVHGNYICSVTCSDFAAKLNKEAVKQSKKCKIHIEIDTGTGRLGVDIKDCLEFAKKIKALDMLVTEGLFMHYSCADSHEESDMCFTKKQTDLFIKAADEIESVLGTAAYKHACAGAAIFNKNAAHFDMVRPGYMLYGYYPNAALQKSVLLKPALKFVSAIIQIREYEEGCPISYNRRYITRRKTRIATVAAGYSDGIRRSLFNAASGVTTCGSGCFVVNGQRAPVCGTICMDLTMIDITDIKGEVKTGDEVAIFDNVNVSIEEIAGICGTIGYEIISQIEDKADRVESF